MLLLNRNIGKYRESIGKAVTIQYLPMGGVLTERKYWIVDHRFETIFLKILFFKRYFFLRKNFLTVKVPRSFLYKLAVKNVIV